MARTWPRLLIALLVSLATVGVAHAQADDTKDADDAGIPSGPSLRPVPDTRVVCDAPPDRARFVEIRGVGFDAWSGQRLIGTLVNAAGSSLAQWPSVWVTPTGRLTVEVNICADAFRGRPALSAGDYGIAVGPSGSAPLAATGFTLQDLPLPAAASTSDDTGDDAMPTPAD